MAITKFIYTLLFIAILCLFYTQDDYVETYSQEKQALLQFHNSTVYDISQDGLLKVAKFNKTIIYDDYEESYYSKITLRGKNKDNKTIIKANKILKEKDILYLDGNVVFSNNDNFKLETEKLQYNLETKIAQNKNRFILSKDLSTMTGKNLYLDVNTNSIKSSETKFRINLKD